MNFLILKRPDNSSPLNLGQCGILVMLRTSLFLTGPGIPKTAYKG